MKYVDSDFTFFIKQNIIGHFGGFQMRYFVDSFVSLELSCYLYKAFELLFDLIPQWIPQLMITRLVLMLPNKNIEQVVNQDGIGQDVFLQTFQIKLCLSISQSIEFKHTKYLLNLFSQLFKIEVQACNLFDRCFEDIA